MGADGAPLGAVDGALLGDEDGTLVGEALRGADGADEGCALGVLVGQADGAAVTKQAAPESSLTSVNATTLVPPSSHATSTVLASLSMVTMTAP